MSARTTHPSAHRCAHDVLIGWPCGPCDQEVYTEGLVVALRAIRHPDPSWAMPDVRDIAARALRGEDLTRYERFRGADRSGPPTDASTQEQD